MNVPSDSLSVEIADNVLMVDVESSGGTCDLFFPDSNVQTHTSCTTTIAILKEVAIGH